MFGALILLLGASFGVLCTRSVGVTPKGTAVPYEMIYQRRIPLKNELLCATLMAIAEYIWQHREVVANTM